MAVIDVITFNGEYDLFDIRYNILKDYVDEFIVVEFDKTFSGKEKPYYFEGIKDKYPKSNYWQYNDQHYSKYLELALSSPNTEYGKGAQHWIREFCQKESIKDCLTHLNDDDIVFIGDCDEIWEPAIWKGDWFLYYKIWKFKLSVYAYYLNQRSNEEFWGTIMGQYRNIMGECLNHLRVQGYKTRIEDGEFGWHFTSVGGFEAVKKKLEDSYTKQTYAADEVLEHLEGNIIKQRDFLGRDFKYNIDESHWPQYLKDNRAKYAHLCK